MFGRVVSVAREVVRLRGQELAGLLSSSQRAVSGSARFLHNTHGAGSADCTSLVPYTHQLIMPKTDFPINLLNHWEKDIGRVGGKYRQHKDGTKWMFKKSGQFNPVLFDRNPYANGMDLADPDKCTVGNNFTRQEVLQARVLTEMSSRFSQEYPWFVMQIPETSIVYKLCVNPKDIYQRDKDGNLTDQERIGLAQNGYVIEYLASRMAPAEKTVTRQTKYEYLEYMQRKQEARGFHDLLMFFPALALCASYDSLGPEFTNVMFSKLNPDQPILCDFGIGLGVGIRGYDKYTAASPGYVSDVDRVRGIRGGRAAVNSDLDWLLLSTNGLYRGVSSMEMAEEIYRKNLTVRTFMEGNKVVAGSDKMRISEIFHEVAQAVQAEHNDPVRQRAKEAHDERRASVTGIFSRRCTGRVAQAELLQEVLEFFYPPDSKNLDGLLPSAMTLMARYRVMKSELGDAGMAKLTTADKDKLTSVLLTKVGDHTMIHPHKPQSFLQEARAYRAIREAELEVKH